MADPMTTDTAALVARLRELAEKATPGPWEADSEKDEHGMMFATMHSGAQPYYALFDSMNADYRVVSCEQEYDDEGGVIAWDETARRNFALIAELRNALPQILSALEALSAPAADGEVEAVARARAKALEEAAVIAETWFDKHRPKQPEKTRFNIYDIEHWAKSATRLVAEDIRARAALKGEA